VCERTGYKTSKHGSNGGRRSGDTIRMVLRCQKER
jgi:hypothetical protein